MPLTRYFEARIREIYLNVLHETYPAEGRHWSGVLDTDSFGDESGEPRHRWKGLSVPQMRRSRVGKGWFRFSYKNSLGTWPWLGDDGVDKRD